MWCDSSEKKSCQRMFLVDGGQLQPDRCPVEDEPENSSPIITKTAKKAISELRLDE